MADKILNSFDVWITAQGLKSQTRLRSIDNMSLDGVRKLREFVLELAIQGKLVPQNSNDEPASELIKKNEKEKIRLTELGEIKEQKKLPEISEESKPFSIPSTWRFARLGDVTNYGFRQQIGPDEISENEWVLELEDIEKITSRLLLKVYAKERPPRSSKNRFFKGDVLYGKLRPYLDKVIIADEDGVCTTEMIPLKGYTSIVPEYLKLVMKSPSFVRYASESTHGMNLPRLGTDNARLAIIPIAPLNEQRRIVAKVDELMALCDELEREETNHLKSHQLLVETLLGTLTNAADATDFQQAWSKLEEHFDDIFTTEDSIDQLKQTILQLAVMGKLVPQDPYDEPASELLKRVKPEILKNRTESNNQKAKSVAPSGEVVAPIVLPKGWTCCHLGDLVDIVSGVTLGKSYKERTVLVPYLRVANVQRGFVDISDVKKLAVPKFEIGKYALNKGDLLMIEGGDWDKVGRCAVWQGEISPCIHQNHIFRLRLNSSLSIEFIEQYLNSPIARNYFETYSKQTTNLASINKTQLRSTPILVPPRLEQDRIVMKISQLIGLCDRLKEKIVESQKTANQMAEAVLES